MSDRCPLGYLLFLLGHSVIFSLKMNFFFNYVFIKKKQKTNKNDRSQSTLSQIGGHSAT